MIVLASKSLSRRAMLEAAGVPFRYQAAGLDERAVERQAEDQSPGAVARVLAEAKAKGVDGGGDLVLGSDSLVSVEGRRFDKPGSRDEAAVHLAYFSGKTMELYSAAAIAREREVVWSHTDVARLHVRILSPSFIEDYLDAEWPAVAGCVGAFRIEARGVQLFSAIEGDQFTVLGMPLLAVLGALRDIGELPA